MKTKTCAFTKITVLATAFSVLVLAGCLSPTEEEEGGNSGGGGGSSSNTTIGNATLVTVGYSSPHTISRDGKHWFKFEGTGETVIFETRGNIVDPSMTIWDDYDRAKNEYTSYRVGNDNNSGEGNNNALISLNTVSGTTYFIRITSSSNSSDYSPSGTYTFVVTVATVNAKAESILITAEYDSAHTISSGNQHWFKIEGTGNNVIFETASQVVTTNIEFYIGDNTNAILTDKNRISFNTAIGTTYYIKITGNSGTYTFSVRNGTSDGSSRTFAIPVTVGYSSPHNISEGGAHWFSFFGTGEAVIFETTGAAVDTYMEIYNGNSRVDYDNNSGEGNNNALISLNTVLGTTYFVRITGRDASGFLSYGTYTFVVMVSTANTRATNPILVATGYSSSHTISSGGQHWFKIEGTGGNVIFETTSKVVTTNIELYRGDNTDAILTDKSRISFSIVSGTTYYIKITGNSGTYTFSVRNGIGDGSSRTFAIPVTVGYSSPHNISEGGAHWFSFLGTGETVIFETTGAAVDTYMDIYTGNSTSSYPNSDNNSGEGNNNALISLKTTSSTVYFIRITSRDNTQGYLPSGVYIFVVR
jgi:hypothetical protein